jgi:hypothetical protein
MQDILELFDRYWSQDMTDMERADFEQRLDTDADFAAKYEDYKLLNQGITYHDLMPNLETAFTELEAEGFFFTVDDFEDYIFGHMNSETQMAFEQRMEQDTEFAAQVESTRLLYKGIALGEEQQLKKNIDTAFSELEAEGYFATLGEEKKTENEIGKVISLYTYLRPLAIAASVLGVIFLGWFWVNKQTQTEIAAKDPQPKIDTTKPQEIIPNTHNDTLENTPVIVDRQPNLGQSAREKAEYVANLAKELFEPEQRDLVAMLETGTRGSGRGIKEEVKDLIYEKYNNITTDTLRAIINSQSISEKERDCANYYYANVLIKNKQYQTAIQSLNAIKNAKNLDVQTGVSSVAWYKAIALAATGKFDAALFQQVADDNNSPFRDKLNKFLNLK